MQSQLLGQLWFIIDDDALNRGRGKEVQLQVKVEAVNNGSVANCSTVLYLHMHLTVTYILYNK